MSRDLPGDEPPKPRAPPASGESSTNPRGDGPDPEYSTFRAESDGFQPRRQAARGRRRPRRSNPLAEKFEKPAAGRPGGNAFCSAGSAPASSPSSAASLPHT